MLGRVRGKAVDSVESMTAFGGEEARQVFKKKSSDGGELPEEQTQEIPKVRVRHPRVVEEVKETKSEEPSVFAFKGNNLFDFPEPEEPEETNAINMFDDLEEDEQDSPLTEEPIPSFLEEPVEKKAEPVCIAEPELVAEPEEVEEEEEPDYLVTELPPAKEETMQEVKSEAIKSLVNSHTVISDKVIHSVQNFMKLNSGLITNEVEIRYADDYVEQVELLRNGSILLPNKCIYFGTMAEKWDSLFEVRVPCGKELELELGVSFTLPDNFALEFSGNDLMRDKHGLELADGKVLLTRQEAFLPIVLRLRSISDVSYVSKFGKIIQCKLKQLD